MGHIKVFAQQRPNCSNHNSSTSVYFSWTCSSWFHCHGYSEYGYTEITFLIQGIHYNCALLQTCKSLSIHPIKCVIQNKP